MLLRHPEFFAQVLVLQLIECVLILGMKLAQVSKYQYGHAYLFALLLQQGLVRSPSVRPCAESVPPQLFHCGIAISYKASTFVELCFLATHHACALETSLQRISINLNLLLDRSCWDIGPVRFI